MICRRLRTSNIAKAMLSHHERPSGEPRALQPESDSGPLPERPNPVGFALSKPEELSSRARLRGTQSSSPGPKIRQVSPSGQPLPEAFTRPHASWHVPWLLPASIMQYKLWSQSALPSQISPFFLMVTHKDTPPVKSTQFCSNGQSDLFRHGMKQ